jgi:predicted secreted Zn-dependent protease
MTLSITTWEDALENRSLSHRLTGRRLAQVTRRIQEIQEGNHEFGIGHYRSTFQYEYDSQNGRISSVKLECRFMLYMPAWVYRNQAPTEEQVEWRRFYRALLYHEQGHYDIFVRYCRRMYRQLRRASTRDELERVFRSVEVEHDAQQTLYDMENENGTTQNTPAGNTIITVPSEERLPGEERKEKKPKSQDSGKKRMREDQRRTKEKQIKKKERTKKPT